MQYIDSLRPLFGPGKRVNLVSLPGIGIEEILELSAGTHGCRIITIDARGFTGRRARSQFLQTISACLVKCSASDVLVITRFERNTLKLDKRFFSELRKIVFTSQHNVIISTNKPLERLYPEELENNHSIITDTQYLKPLPSKLAQEQFNCSAEQYRLGGGHLHLIKSLDSLSPSELTERICQELIAFFDTATQNVLRKIARNEYADYTSKSARLLQRYGVISSSGDICMPLLFNFAAEERKDTELYLTPNESALLQVLMKNFDGLTTKDEIITAVWGETSIGHVSDWSLNSLIYRLRNNDYFRSTNYVIRSHKKRGYSITGRV